jgi:squalene-hopene/tetraprenyl-beta-curcumene cyclase
VTAHVLEMLAHLGYGCDEPHVRRGLAYLWHQQQADGAWFGRWGDNYIYGTSAVLPALAAFGMGTEDAWIARAAAWLHSR